MFINLKVLKLMVTYKSRKFLPFVTKTNAYINLQFAVGHFFSFSHPITFFRRQGGTPVKINTSRFSNLQTKFFIRHDCCVHFYLAHSLQVSCEKYVITRLTLFWYLEYKVNRRVNRRSRSFVNFKTYSLKKGMK